ncbi:hypothetical protein [Nocardia sp. alder85J]|uniref:hypothetical protein n=1 Tax=Nocardia sp. alder85J TaxID=2862949 RepID=UPI001CD2BF4D|nr:hypothetical protein [Nocardia sp. alder85J]MCX4096256.1 hypothetical protein [Nocardia sp. alder85J]
MATGVGLRIAEDVSIAAIVTSVGSAGSGVGSAASGAPEPHYILRDSVLHMADDGDTELGGEPPPGHTHSITGFLSAMGDPAGVSVDSGPAYRPEDLLATALFCLINLAAEHLVGSTEFYATHPAEWPEEYVRSLRDALDYLGLRAVVLVSEADLPAAESDPAGYGLAAAAARAAVAAVLSTPAGATPPDPTHAETALQVTDVLPALNDPRVAQAYSAAMPLAEPEPLVPAATVATENVPPATMLATTATRLPRRQRRTTALVAAAALLGLLLGAVVVGVAWRANVSPAAPNARLSPTPTTAAVPPPPAPEPTPSSVEPVDTPETPETTEAPPEPTTTTDTPPPSPAPTTPTTTPRPTSRAPRGSTTRTPSYPYPYPYPYGDPYGSSPDLPRLPTLQIPQ